MGGTIDNVEQTGHELKLALHRDPVRTVLVVPVHVVDKERQNRTKSDGLIGQRAKLPSGPQKGSIDGGTWAIA